MSTAGRATDGAVRSTLDRRRKLERLRAAGIDPFPTGGVRSRTAIADLTAAHDPCALAVGEHTEVRCAIAGRLTERRGQQLAMFFDVRDESDQMQVYVRRDVLGESGFDRALDFDIGDIVAVEGCLFVTHNRQVALRADALRLLGKALRPPPHGSPDLEVRRRQRELDLMANAEARELVATRAAIVRAIRRWFEDHRFVEVDTPALQPRYGGALARPFVTHHNALDRDLYLRISAQLYLARCIVGGFERVYHFGKCFRNEGFSHEHSPEFTLLEFTHAYASYVETMAFIEDLVAFVAQQVLGKTVIERNGVSVDLAPPWQRVSVRDALLEAAGIDILSASIEDLAAAARMGADSSRSDVLGRLFAEKVEAGLVQPTFVVDFPAELCIFGRPHSHDARLIAHFDAYVGGLELASGSTELNDPDRQREIFLERSQEVPGRPEAFDEDLLQALEYGTPPTAGAGIGVDRLVMLLTGQRSLRDVVLFPALRPRP